MGRSHLQPFLSGWLLPTFLRLAVFGAWERKMEMGKAALGLPCVREERKPVDRLMIRTGGATVVVERSPRGRRASEVQMNCHGVLSEEPRSEHVPCCPVSPDRSDCCSIRRKGSICGKERVLLLCRQIMKSSTVTQRDSNNSIPQPKHRQSSSTS